MNFEAKVSWPGRSSKAFSLLKSINKITNSALEGRRLSPDTSNQIVYFAGDNDPLRQETLKHCREDLKGLLAHINEHRFKTKNTHILSLAKTKLLLKRLDEEVDHDEEESPP